MKYVIILCILYAVAGFGQDRATPVTDSKFVEEQRFFYVNKSKTVTWNLTDEQILHLAQWHKYDKMRKVETIYIPIKWQYTDTLFYRSNKCWPPFVGFETHTVLSNIVADIHDPAVITYVPVNVVKMTIGKPATTGSLLNIHEWYKRGSTTSEKAELKQEIEEKLSKQNITASVGTIEP